MKHTKKVVLSLMLVLALLLSGCQFFLKSDDKQINPDMDFDTFTLELFKDSVSSDALSLNYTLKDPSAYGIELDEITFGRVNLDNLKEGAAESAQLLAALRSYDYNSLTADQQLTYDILEDFIKTDMSFYDYYFYDEVLDPTTGLQTQLPVLLSEYSFYDQSYVDNYILLLKDVLPYYESIMAFEKAKSEQGLFMSDAIADKIIDQCKAFIENPETNLLLEMFEDKLDEEVPGLSDDDRQTYIEANEEAVLNYVIPAYQLMIDELEALKGTGKNDGGLYYFDDGKDYYTTLVRYKTGSAKTPAQLIDFIEESMDSVMMEIALVMLQNSNVYSEVMSAEYLYSDPMESLDYLKEAMLKNFPEGPDVNYQVKYVHKSLQDYISPAFYLTPALDDIFNNVIYVNIKDESELDDLFPTIAHEGYPGHLYQMSYFYNTNPAEIRRALSFTGYSEGWATYVEGISYQYSGVTEDAALFMKNNLIYTLGIYGRIDLGIHYEGWMIDDVFNYLDEQGISDMSVAQEIFDAILSSPANYLAYCVGGLEILSMRDKAEKELDESFNEIEFHRFLLEIGPAQFDIIDKYMDQWLKTQN